MKNTKRYFAEIIQQTDGTFKIGFTKELVDVNQHKRCWKRVNARSIARKLNRGTILIK